MYQRNPKTGEVLIDTETGERALKTSHSLNPVPVYFYDPAGQAGLRLARAENLGISSLAATCIKLLGYEPPNDYDPSIVDVG